MRFTCHVILNTSAAYPLQLSFIGAKIKTNCFILVAVVGGDGDVVLCRELTFFLDSLCVG